jgi:hypothetical protein
MALTKSQKRTIRRALCDRRASATLISVIDSGTATALSGKVERSISTAFAGKRRATAIIANIESGTAMSYASKKHLAYAIGKTKPVAGIATLVNALS